MLFPESEVYLLPIKISIKCHLTNSSQAQRNCIAVTNSEGEWHAESKREPGEKYWCTEKHKYVDFKKVNELLH